MILFFLYISFVIALYVLMKKAFPVLNAYVFSYQEKITDRFSALEIEHKKLSDQIAQLSRDVNLLQQEIDMILQEGHNQVIALNASYNKSIGQIVKDKKEIAQRHIDHLELHFQQYTRELIAKKTRNYLMVWIQSQSTNNTFHERLHENIFRYIK